MIKLSLLFRQNISQILAFFWQRYIKISDYTKINNDAINLKKGKQLFFQFFYSLDLIKLETLKIYIKTNITNGFIWLFKFFTKILIFFH